MALQLYATVASIGWMFVQGHFLHSKVTTNVFGLSTPFRAYLGVGWGKLHFSWRFRMSNILHTLSIPKTWLGERLNFCEQALIQ